MPKWSRYCVGVVAITGWLAFVVGADAETCKLETKRLDEASRTVIGGRPAQYWFQAARPQSFFMQIGGPEGMIRGSEEEGTPEFSKVISKEPSSYHSKHPFRGVAKLGSQHFGFVLDSAKAQEELEQQAEGEAREDQEPGEEEAASDSETEEASDILRRIQMARQRKPPEAYTRLHFDINHNGDLTDDEVIEATSDRSMPDGYAAAVFPAVKLTIDVEGVPVDYAFVLNVYSQGMSQFAYANASLRAATYREGEMTIDGKTLRVVVVDFNSNGRYDDQAMIDERVLPSDGTVYPSIGDMLYLIDPDQVLDQRANPYDPSSTDALHYVARQIHFGSRFFDLKITPAGDELTLEPSPNPVGYVTNPNKGYRAIVYGEQGFLKIAGDESGKAPLPAGDWKLASYTIDRTVTDEPDQEESQEKSTFGALKDLLLGAGSSAGQPRIRPTVVSARGTRDYPAVRVTEGQISELPFGEPYSPKVSIRYRDGMRSASLSMELMGSGGEICSAMTVNGTRPEKPKFTIYTEEGEVVDTGDFEYG